MATVVLPGAPPTLNVFFWEIRLGNELATTLSIHSPGAEAPLGRMIGTQSFFLQTEQTGEAQFAGPVKGAPKINNTSTS